MGDPLGSGASQMWCSPMCPLQLTVAPWIVATGVDGGAVVRRRDGSLDLIRPLYTCSSRLLFFLICLEAMIFLLYMVACAQIFSSFFLVLYFPLFFLLVIVYCSYCLRCASGPIGSLHALHLCRFVLFCFKTMPCYSCSLIFPLISSSFSFFSFFFFECIKGAVLISFLCFPFLFPWYGRQWTVLVRICSIVALCLIFFESNSGEYFYNKLLLFRCGTCVVR